MNLSLKLNATLLVAFGILALAVVLVINASFATLLLQVSQQQLAQDMSVAQQNFATMEASILNAARVVSDAPGLLVAVEAGDTNALQTTILLQAAALNQDEIHIVDAEKKNLLAETAADNVLEQSSESRLYDLALTGAAVTGIVFEEEDGEEDAYLVGVVPVKNERGDIVGAIMSEQKIDGAFMDDLDFARADTHIAFIHDGEVIAADLSKPEEFDEDELQADASRVEQAARGQAWISEQLVPDEDNTPDAVAYVPLRVNNELAAVLAIRKEFEPLYVFQSQLVASTVVVVAVLSVIALAVAALLLRLNVTLPIQRLKVVAEQITAGNLRQRAIVHSTDELGQLALSFNKMTDQLGNLVNQLELRVQEAHAAQAVAERSEQAKSAFLTTMSHELRTPLNAVINLTRYVNDGHAGPLTEQQTELLGDVAANGKHLLTMINNVLDMSKIEADSLTLFAEDKVDLADIVRKAAATGESLLFDKPVTMQLNIADNLPLIRGDRQRLLQIMLNIVSNACKFTEEGSIEISARQVDQQIVIAVKDTGPGIAPEEQPSVFEAFKQTEAGLRSGGGTGLGMSISKNLVEAHGGRLWIDSDVGKGATFFVALPVNAEALAAVYERNS